MAPDATTAASILQHVRERVSPYKRIRRLEFAALPKTISGKIRRVELRQLEHLLDEYYTVQSLDPAKAPLVLERIGQLVEQTRLYRDFEMDEAPAADRLPEDLRNGLRRALLGMAADPAARPWLARGLIERFAAVDDSSYDDLRRMRRACEEADFLTLH